MGRGKIEIKRIENTNNRQVTYSKRRNGILKKAKEISVLCEAKVSVVIIGSNGKMHEFCTPNTQLSTILDTYHNKCGKRLWDAKHENLDNEINRVRKENENMQLQLKRMKGDEIGTLTAHELMSLEDVLENGCSALRAKQMDIVHKMRKHNEMMEEENQGLQFKLRQMHLDCLEDNVLENQGIYDHHQGIADYENQMPFAFRVQPMQPNLQGHY